jgi:hypothetical protein
MKKLGVAEILEKASEIKEDHDKVRWLRANDSQALRMILVGAFDPSIKWLLPDGEPPYKPNDLVDQQHRLYTESRKLYLFIEGGNPDLKQLRREVLFIQLLECLDPADAKLLLAVKDKRMPYSGVTKDTVNLAFPGLITA